MTRRRVAVISELPTPYRWPVYRRLLERPELDLRIFFCARRERDRDWSFPFEPDDRVRFLPGRTFSHSGSRTIHYHVNPTIFGELSGGNFEVVVLPGWAMFASQAGALWCRASGTPYVLFSETTGLGSRSPAARALRRLLVPPIVTGAAAWLGTGSLSRDHLVAWGAREADVHPFPNSPDVAWFQEQQALAAPAREAVRERDGAGSEPVILFVGRLLRAKRADLVIGAAGRLLERGREFSVWIVGEGPERPALQAMARRRGMRNVRFPGSVGTADLPAIYDAADVFVLPSDHEPWGAVVGEAMACGLPVVVSDHVGSAPDLVRPGENGETFARGDEAALADALDRVLSDAGRRQRMGGQSAIRIAEFSHDACIKSFLRAVETAARAR